MSIDLDAYREQSVDSWGGMASGWEARREWLMTLTAPVFDWILSKTGPQPGETFLDLAGGTGDLGFRIAARVGAEGRVIYGDFAPEMVDLARRLGAADGIRNIEYRVLDAENMDLPDDSVDAVVCRWGYMLMADPAAALRETRRVLREDGRLAFVVWTTPDRNPWAAVPAMTLVQRGHIPPPEPGAPGMFALGDPRRIRELVMDAGFSEPEVEPIEFEFRYADADDLWGSTIDLAGPLARAIGGLSEAEQEATRAAIIEKAAPYRNEDNSYTAPASCWGVLAR